MFNDLKSHAAMICGGQHTLPWTQNYDTGAPGLYLERQFNVAVNNLDVPDLTRHELKYVSIASKTPLTLFQNDPRERPKRGNKKQGRARIPGANEDILNRFGYFKKGRRTFYHMVRGGKPTTGDRVSGFYVKVEGDLIKVYHVSDKTPIATWFTEVIVNAFISKFRRLVVFSGKRTGMDMRFNGASMHQVVRSSQILPMIADGTIMIDFGLYFKPNGTVRTRGVKFRIYPKDLPKLYLGSEVLCGHA